MNVSRFVFALVATAGAASTAMAAVQDINGFKLRGYNFYDHTNATTSYLNVGGSGQNTAFPAAQESAIAIPGLAGAHKIIESYPAADDGVGGSFANRHLMLFSADGGATTYKFTGTENFSISARVEMKTRGQSWAVGAGNNAEAGMFGINDQGGGWLAENTILGVADGTSFANDTFTGGGPDGFQLFGQGNGTGTPLVTDVLNGDGTRSGGLDITFIYQAPADLLSPPSTTNQSFTRVIVRDINSGVTKDTLWRALGDNLWAIDGFFELGFVIQNGKQQDIIDSSFETTVSNLKVIPAPGAMALLGLGGLVAARRRRN